MELGHPQSGRGRWRKSLLPWEEVCYKEAAWVYHWCQNTAWAPSSAPPVSLQAPWAKTQNDKSFCLLLLLLFTPGLGMYTLWDSIISAHITFCYKWWIMEPVSIWEYMGVQWNRQEGFKYEEFCTKMRHFKFVPFLLPQGWNDLNRF